MAESPDLVARTLEQISSLLAKYTADRDRRFQLTCFALSGLAPEFHKTGGDESAEDIGKRAVELAEATLRALAT
jgi:hypothetical protein